MPFKSQAQMRYMFANKPEMAKEWADKTQNIKNLPERIGANSTLKEKKKRIVKKLLSKYNKK